MVKKMLLLLLLFLLSTPLVSAAPTKTSNITLPPLPKTDQETEQVAIFMTEREMNEQEILGLTKKYPDIQLRTIFQYALKGFSAKGSSRSLEKLAKEIPMTKFSVVHQYKTMDLFHHGDNVRIIGGDEAKGVNRLYRKRSDNRCD